ncbi:hypothetical protein BHE74_00008563 [Ensete ventricosum]|nr:hypothetical protein BHE74_00008563 [Ensete ventricosum]
MKQGSSYRSIPAYRNLAGTVRAVCVPVNHRTGMYRSYRAVHGSTENLVMKKAMLRGRGSGSKQWCTNFSEVSGLRKLLGDGLS